ncbi:unnamed protein product [Leptidea sinapis]|nr:unnamed protein product [Leptidea sinapis]
MLIGKDRPPVIPERAPALPERGPNVPERGPNVPERGPNVPERGSFMSERGSIISEQGPAVPERVQVGDRRSKDRALLDNDRSKDRNSNERSSSERFDKNANEGTYEYRYSERIDNRNSGEKQSVSSLVNSYQQKVKSSQEKEPNRNSAGWNSNWQGVETTSHFYTASELAYSGSNTRPASVAGSGGSPALDPRPASRSSGESELSVGGTKEKKDKKGVFGGLFSRKKRPQSHM